MQNDISINSLLNISNKVKDIILLNGHINFMSKKIGEDEILINNYKENISNLTYKDLILVNKNNFLQNKNSDIEIMTHFNIYKQINKARHILKGSPTYTNVISLKYDYIKPLDHNGKSMFGKIKIYNLDSYLKESRYINNIICKIMREENTDIVVIRGYGVYIYGMDEIETIITKLTILEESCKIIYLANTI